MSVQEPPTQPASLPNQAPKLQSADQNPVSDPGRSLPSANDAERSILSSMLQDPQQYIGIALEEKLSADSFYVPAHATLYKAALQCFDANRPIELISFIQSLEDQNQLQNVGGHAEVSETFYFAATSAHFKHHLNLVKDKYTLRSVVATCTEAISQAFSDPENVPELLDSVEQRVLKIREGSDTNKALTIKEAVGEVLELFEQAISGDSDTQGVPTSYVDLDRMSGGLKPGEMFIIAARPSMGKTSFVMNIVEHVALDRKDPVMVFSLEMSTQQIVQRLLFSRSKFVFSNLQKGFKPTKADFQRIKRASGEIADSKLFIDDTPSISISELRAKARRKHRDEGIKLIAVDYLQLMKSNSKQATNSREREVAEISAGLKGLAKELGIPIIVLAQLNRGPESRTGSSLGVPRMSDLRESGSIEQDADLIGLLYRTAYYADSEEAKEEEAGKAELIISKNRNGETGHVPLTFIAELMRFETRARDADEHS